MQQTNARPEADEQRAHPVRVRPAGDGRRAAAEPVRSWWRRPWVVPLLIIAIAFVAYAIPPYLELDPDLSRIAVRPDFPGHFPLLVAHIAFGSIAVLTAPFQLWPWLRRRNRRLHRLVGRVYVFGGALPAAVVALVITPVSAGPPGNAISGVLWIITTVVAYVMVRKHNYAEHRRWMLYSVALAYTIVWGRIMFLTIPMLPNFRPGWVPLIAETATWIGLVFNLIFVQWWLEHTARKGMVVTAAS